MSATTDAEHKFWAYLNQSSKYQDLAEAYERNIEVKHAASVTSKRMCCCLDYYGPDVKNL